LQWFLTILFTLTLCFNKRERATATAGRKNVCELRYPISRDRPKNSNLIEKMVSKRNEKSSKINQFSPFFFASPLCFNKREWAAAAAGQKHVCELRYPRSCDRPENSNSIEKMVSRSNGKSSKLNRFSPLFFASPLCFNKLERSAAAAG
jgi:hypothetical protein